MCCSTRGLRTGFGFGGRFFRTIGTRIGEAAIGERAERMTGCGLGSLQTQNSQNSNVRARVSVCVCARGQDLTAVPDADEITSNQKNVTHTQ